MAFPAGPSPEQGGRAGAGPGALGRDRRGLRQRGAWGRSAPRHLPFGDGGKTGGPSGGPERPGFPTRSPPEPQSGSGERLVFARLSKTFSISKILSVLLSRPRSPRKVPFPGVTSWGAAHLGAVLRVPGPPPRRGAAHLHLLGPSTHRGRGVCFPVVHLRRQHSWRRMKIYQLAGPTPNQ